MYFNNRNKKKQKRGLYKCLKSRKLHFDGGKEISLVVLKSILHKTYSRRKLIENLIRRRRKFSSSSSSSSYMKVYECS